MTWLIVIGVVAVICGLIGYFSGEDGSRGEKAFKGAAAGAVCLRDVPTCRRSRLYIPSPLRLRGREADVSVGRDRCGILFGNW